VIPAEASLAKNLLDDPSCLKTDKLFIGIPEDHNQELSDPTYLANKIATFLTPLESEKKPEIIEDAVQSTYQQIKNRFAKYYSPLNWTI
jgi:hypothetical protein